MSRIHWQTAVRRSMAFAVFFALALVASGPDAWASSHREAPFITKHPKVDGTDFYMFRSYETARLSGPAFVTLVACYLPLQDPYGGPNYFTLDDQAVYEIHVENTGDAREDLTFQFRFQNNVRDLTVPVGPANAPKNISVPLINIGAFTTDRTANLNIQNVVETFSVKVIRGNRRTGKVQTILNADTGESSFIKPVDNIGQKSIPDYASYANLHLYNINLPNADGTLTAGGKLFVGQRKDPFVVNLGETFDLVNITGTPLGSVSANKDSLADKNVTALCLEVPASYLAQASNPVIGGWTTASMRQARVLNPKPPRSSAGKPSLEGGALVQQSRLGMPLVNEVVIGLKDKDRFNASKPEDDGQFADYVTHPSLPKLLEILFGSVGVRAPTTFPRSDLVQVFLTGVPNLNQFSASAKASEMQRLNTSTAATPATSQNNLGVIAGDAAGFPNGRRPGDDVVDIALRVVMGKLLPASSAASGQLNFTDGALVTSSMFDNRFPYLRNPLAGSPNR